MQLKYVEILFDKEKPQVIGTEIKITAQINEDIDGLEYKFIVGRGGIWKTIREFSNENICLWTPNESGNYIVMIQAREKNGKKPLDYLAKEDFEIVESMKKKNFNINDYDIEIKKAASLDEEEKHVIYKIYSMKLR